MSPIPEESLAAAWSKKKNFRFRLWASDKPTPSLSKITYKYNYVDLYSGVVFIFF